MLYPLKFESILLNKIWGGNQLRKFGKQIDEKDSIGESWEVSGLSENVSIVKNGDLKGNSLAELIEVYMGDLVGDKIYNEYGHEFPLLIKLIDATDVLSVQVHPDNATAINNHNSLGKTEMWYILNSNQDSFLVNGFNKDVSKSDFLNNLKSGEFKDFLNYQKVKPGESYYIPAGRIHAIGGGITLAEIQQSSDVTYRVYDWDRVDDKGNSRELHLNNAIEVLDFNKVQNVKTDYSKKLNEVVNIETREYFTVNKINLTKEINRDFYTKDSFVIYMCIEGEALIEGEFDQIKITKGETILMPAIFKDFYLIPEVSCELLEIYMD